MTDPDLDDARLTDSLHRLAGRAAPSPDALESVQDRHQRHRRNRARLTAVASATFALVVAVAAANLADLGRDVEVSATERAPVGAEGDGAAAPRLLPAFVSVDWLKAESMGLYEGEPEERPDRWVQSNYRGDDGRRVQLSAEHNPQWTSEEKAAERDGRREEVAGPRGSRVILIADRGRYWAYWTEGEWQFELDAGGLASRDEALEILQGVQVDAGAFEELKLALRDNVHITRPGDPPVTGVVVAGSFEGTPWRVTELARPEGQWCLGLEPERAHRWFCLPSDAGAFSGEDPSITPGPKFQVGDYWLYAALVEGSTSVRVHTEAADGTRHTLTLAPAPLGDGAMGVAVGFIPTTVVKVTTEFVEGSGRTTWTTTQSMGSDGPSRSTGDR